MKWLFLCVLICLAGCVRPYIDRYVRQSDELDRQLSAGEFAYFNGADLWGRKWRLAESSSQCSNDFVDVFLKYRSYGEDLSNDGDDVEVLVHQHYCGCELISWGYSYYYDNGGGIETGGCEFD